MIFNSLEFLIFLPIVFLLYWFASRKSAWQNALIVVASCIFYGWWSWKLLFLIIGVISAAFAAGYLIDKLADKQKIKKGIATLFIVAILAILATFKYFNFFAENLIALLKPLGITPGMITIKLVLPIGISFYTFQAIGYIVDVYKGRIVAERNFITFTAFISFFPQLVAGPIERAANLLPQFHKHRVFDYTLAADGMKQMLWGFFKKLAIADNCGAMCDVIFNDFQAHSGTTLIYGAILFTIQIYSDFSGYSDIAIGAAKLFGIRLTQNFNNPYFAHNIHEFWRRWHISLTSWFRDFVYIPLDGNRHGKMRQAINTLIVFTTSGLWHGANWTFVTWGAYNAILYIPFIFTKKKQSNTPKALKPFAILLTFSLVVIGFTIFRSETMLDAVAYFYCIGKNFSLSLPQMPITPLYYALLMFAIEWIGRKGNYGIEFVNNIKHGAIRYAIYYILILIALMKVAEGTQFIYFQF